MLKYDKRKEQMIDIASRMLLEKGYEGLSIRSIIQEADASGPGLFYYSFASKQDIYEAAMQHIVKQQLDQRWSIVRDETLDPERKIDRLIESVECDFNRYRNLLDHGDNKQILDTISMTMMTEEIPMAERIINELLERKGVASREAAVDVHELSCFIVYGLNGILREKFANPDTIPDTPTFQSIKRLLVGILKLMQGETPCRSLTSSI